MHPFVLGNTPHPMKKFSAYAHSDPLSVKFQAFHRRYQDDGFGSERPHRGRGGVINKDGATSRRRKEFARPFDREKGSGGKRGRGRGYQLVNIFLFRFFLYFFFY